MGAGSGSDKHTRRTVSGILRNAAKRKKLAQLIFRIVKHYSPETIVEMGTSAGLTTAYLALGGGNARVITIEGAPEIAALARRNIDLLKVQNIRLVEGSFDHLEEELERLPHVDLAFVDGNHGKVPTLSYFSQLLKKVNASSILIFDDIRWSKEMEEAWKTIKLHENVTLSIDLFFLGIVFFREEFKVKQHFTIRY
jgi:predicted O-methyltransferase YrrM